LSYYFRSRRATIFIQPHSQLTKTPSETMHKRAATGTKKEKSNYNHLRRFSRGDSLPGFTKISSKTVSRLCKDVGKIPIAEEVEQNKMQRERNEGEENVVLDGFPNATQNANKSRKRVSKPISDRSDLHLIGSGKRRNTIAVSNCVKIEGLFIRGLNKNKEAINIPSNPFMK
jgi:hypothetical protein